MANFIATPNMKPMNEPTPERNAKFVLRPVIISPATAPTKGPSIIPNGTKNKPSNKPTIEPIVPARLPPNFFVPHAGRT